MSNYILNVKASSLYLLERGIQPIYFDISRIDRLFEHFIKIVIRKNIPFLVKHSLNMINYIPFYSTLTNSVNIN